MMEANEAMKAMARRICAQIVEGDSDNPVRVQEANRYLAGDRDDFHDMRIALAAIIETQRLDAELADSVYPKRTGIWATLALARYSAAIRTGEHYALAGER